MEPPPHDQTEHRHGSSPKTGGLEGILATHEFAVQYVLAGNW